MTLIKNQTALKPALTNRVKEYRNIRHLSVAECASHLHVTRQTIYGVEKGNFELSTENWLKLADFLGCDLRTLRPVSVV